VNPGAAGQRAALRAGSLLVLVVSLASTALIAQVSASKSFPQVRTGFWFSAGVGYGRLDFSCGGGANPWDTLPPATTCSDAGRAAATLGSLRAGYALSQQVLLSIMLDASHRVGTSEGVMDVGVALRLYPMRERGLFLEAGVSRSEFRNHDPDGPDEVGSGMGAVAALGWDLRVDRMISLTPVLQVHYGYQGDTGTPAVLVLPSGAQVTNRTRVHETLVTFGIALTVH